jgi:hypothetical protein
MQYHYSSESELAEILARFDSYAGVHGDLFEDSDEPLTPEDTVDAAIRRKRFSKRFGILYACGMACVGAGLIFGKRPQGGDYFYIIMLVGAPLIYRMMIMSGFNDALKSKEKRVSHGVITNMQKKGKGLGIEFSRKLTISILPEDYKTLKLGDIVRMEMLANELYIKRKFVIEGKI